MSVKAAYKSAFTLIQYMELKGLHWLTAGMKASGERRWQVTKHYSLRFRPWNDQNCLSLLFECPGKKGTKATDEAVIRAKPWALLAPHGGFHAWIFCFYFGKSEFKYLGEKFIMSISAIKTNVISKKWGVLLTKNTHPSVIFYSCCLFSPFKVYFLSLN